LTHMPDRFAKGEKTAIEGLPFLENVEITVENRERMRGWLTDRIFEHLSIEYEEAINVANIIILKALSRHKPEEL
jgi:hypothetical protein